METVNVDEDREQLKCVVSQMPKSDSDSDLRLQISQALWQHQSQAYIKFPLTQTHDSAPFLKWVLYPF